MRTWHRFLIFGEVGDRELTLTEHLLKENVHVQWVTPGDTYAIDEIITIDFNSAEDWQLGGCWVGASGAGDQHRPLFRRSMYWRGPCN